MNGAEEFLITDGVLREYRGPGGDVTVPAGVTALGSQAFPSFFRDRLRSLRLPEGLQSIEPYALSDCRDLEAVFFPESLREIGEAAFEGCRSLKAVTLPEGLESLGQDAFNGCGALASVSLPGSLREIGEAAFRECGSLKAADLPEGLTRIGPAAFAECGSLESVRLPKSLREIGDHAFRNCGSLRAFAPPGGRVRFGRGAFYGCPGLADGEGFIVVNGTLCQYLGGGSAVTVPKGVRQIGEAAFEGLSSLAAVTLPKGVKRIGERAFRGCDALERVSLPEGLGRIEADAFQDCGRLETLTLPEGLRSVGREAFRNCSSLSSVTLPESLREIGQGAFRRCARLPFLLLPDGLRRLGAEAFRNCRGLRTVILPKDLERLQPWTFENCGALESVSLPEGLREIGEGAFYGCGSLRSLPLPEGLERILPGAFMECEGLADEEGFLVMGGTLIRYYGPGGDVTVPEGVSRIDNWAFSEREDLSGVTLPESLAFIGRGAFSGCTGLKFVSFPAHPVDFRPGAFSFCRGLADGDGFFIRQGVLFLYAGPDGDVTVPEGVTRIDSDALAGRWEDLRLSLPDSLKTVAPDAFPRCRFALRIRRWLPELTRAVRGCEVSAILTETSAGIPAVLRRAARYGAAFWPEAAFSAEKTRKDAAWLSRHAAAVREDAFRLPELMRCLCANRLLPPLCAEEWLAEAQARDSTALTAVLLEYLNDLGPETLRRAGRARQAREAAAAAARAKRLAEREGCGIAGLRVAADETVDLDFWICTSPIHLKARLAEFGAVLQPELNLRTDLLLSDDPGSETPLAKRAAALGIPAVSSAVLIQLARALP